jgi:cytochrome c oxidase subunit 2
VRRQLTFLFLAALAALAAAGTASAAGGGFVPETAHSPNAARTTTAYYLILGLTSAIFVLVEGLLVAFVWKYRSRGRPRTVEGAQVHGHTRLELIWTVFPVVILAVIAGFVFYELPGIDSAPAARDPISITVEGHQYYWQFDYPNGARSIGTLVVPQGVVVDLTVKSSDVIHSWWIPELGGKLQAIPGRTNHTWFRADKQGTYTGQCAELCGLYHASMLARVEVKSGSAYRSYISTAAPQTLGQQEWSGACATCHGMTGKGGYGPDISGSPLLATRSSLVPILQNGLDTPARPGAMPPVGSGWNTAQIRSLIAYVKKHVYKPAAPVGATSG